jgi:hypothetical protein
VESEELFAWARARASVGLAAAANHLDIIDRLAANRNIAESYIDWLLHLGQLAVTAVEYAQLLLEFAHMVILFFFQRPPVLSLPPPRLYMYTCVTVYI